MTCGRNASGSRRHSGSKKRRRSTSGTSSFPTGCTPSSRCRRKTSNRSAVRRLPSSPCCLRGSVASSDATSAAVSTFATACVRYWKKSTIRSRQTGSRPAFSRAYISTSSTSTSVASPSRRGSSSSAASSGSAGGVSRSASAPSACRARSPSAPAIWNASTLHGCRSVRAAPSGPRTPSIPRSASILSKQSATVRAAGRSAPTCSRNSRTAGRSGSAAGSRNRWRRVIRVCVLPPP